MVGDDGKATAYVNSGLVKLGILLVPGQFNWDASLIKTTKLTEIRALQFRTEFLQSVQPPAVRQSSDVEEDAQRLRADQHH